ncbi:MAG: hypothetical protein ACI9Q3_001127, partial [Maribacter sp.]
MVFHSVVKNHYISICLTFYNSKSDNRDINPNNKVIGINIEIKGYFLNNL